MRMGYCCLIGRSSASMFVCIIFMNILRPERRWRPSAVLEGNGLAFMGVRCWVRFWVVATSFSLVLTVCLTVNGRSKLAYKFEGVNRTGKRKWCGAARMGILFALSAPRPMAIIIIIIIIMCATILLYYYYWLLILGYYLLNWQSNLVEISAICPASYASRDARESACLPSIALNRMAPTWAPVSIASTSARAVH